MISITTRVPAPRRLGDITDADVREAVAVTADARYVTDTARVNGSASIARINWPTWIVYVLASVTNWSAS